MQSYKQVAVKPLTLHNIRQFRWEVAAKSWMKIVMLLKWNLLHLESQRDVGIFCDSIDLV